MRHISQIVRPIACRVVTMSPDDSKKKNRAMKLYQWQVITAGDVERLFTKYNLSEA